MWGTDTTVDAGGGSGSVVLNGPSDASSSRIRNRILSAVSGWAASGTPNRTSSTGGVGRERAGNIRLCARAPIDYCPNHHVLDLVIAHARPVPCTVHACLALRTH